MNSNRNNEKNEKETPLGGGVQVTLENVGDLPGRPGVYLFRTASGTILYVGKSKNLRNRVRSYLNPAPYDYKGQRILAEAKTVEFMTVSDEIDALVLENRLIKEFDPPYNVLLKDDKTYPYLKLDIRSRFPLLNITRKIRRDGAKYFGPYRNAEIIRNLITSIQKTFPYGNCEAPLRKRKRPCLLYDMQMCPAPCAGKITEKEYAETTTKILGLLEGKTGEIIGLLRDKIEEHSRKLEFEQALRLRNQIEQIENSFVNRTRNIESPGGGDADYIGTTMGEDCYILNILHLRKGVPTLDSTFRIEREGPLPTTMLATQIEWIYAEKLVVPEKVYIDKDVPVEELQKNLSRIAGKRVKILSPRGKENRELLALSHRNADLRLNVYAHNRTRKDYEDGIVELMEWTGLDVLPETIEGYDISTQGGRDTVGACTRFQRGRFRKGGYRSFLIRGRQDDDYGAIRESLARRLRHTDWTYPDIFLIDGGKGHRAAALEVTERYGIAANRVIALAKREETLYTALYPGGLSVSMRSPGLRLAIRVRDETHRFVIGKSRSRLLKKSRSDLFENLPGWGKIRQQKILEVFPNIFDVLDLTPDEVRQKCPLPVGLIERLQERLRDLQQSGDTP